MSLTLKFKYRFEAAHRFTSSAAPACQTPHGHTWYATAIFKLKTQSLDAAAMAAEFGSLKKSWKSFITETADHSFLHNVSDPLISALIKTTPSARLLPFPQDPTTELIAGLFALKLRTLHHASGLDHILPLGVLIQETPTNSILFKFELTADDHLQAPAWLKKHEAAKSAWWLSSQTDSRKI